MKLTELLISIAIFSLVLVTSFSCYTTFIKNQKKVQVKVKDSNDVLEIDFKIRKEINLLKVLYYENPVKKIGLFKQEILSKKYDDDFFIINCNLIFNKNKVPVGLEIDWQYKENVYKTKECFSFIPVLESVQ